MLWFSEIYSKDFFEFGPFPAYVHVTLLYMYLQIKKGTLN